MLFIHPFHVLLSIFLIFTCLTRNTYCVVIPRVHVIITYADQSSLPLLYPHFQSQPITEIKQYEMLQLINQVKLTTSSSQQSPFLTSYGPNRWITSQTLKRVLLLKGGRDIHVSEFLHLVSGVIPVKLNRKLQKLSASVGIINIETDQRMVANAVAYFQ